MWVAGRLGARPWAFSSPIVAPAMLKITLQNSPPHARARSLALRGLREKPRLAALSRAHVRTCGNMELSGATIILCGGCAKRCAHLFPFNSWHTREAC